MRGVWLGMWLVMSTVAYGAPASSDCPFGPRPRVSTTMTSITVDGTTYPLRGLDNRDTFARVLIRCDVDPLTREAFERWRSSRVGVNVTAAVGIVLWPAWIGTAMFGVNAADRRMQLAEELMMWEP